MSPNSRQNFVPGRWTTLEGLKSIARWELQLGNSCAQTRTCARTEACSPTQVVEAACWPIPTSQEKGIGGATGLEPASSRVTDRRASRLPLVKHSQFDFWKMAPVFQTAAEKSSIRSPCRMLFEFSERIHSKSLQIRRSFSQFLHVDLSERCCWTPFGLHRVTIRISTLTAPPMRVRVAPCEL